MASVARIVLIMWSAVRLCRGFGFLAGGAVHSDGHRGKCGRTLFGPCERDFAFDLADLLRRHPSDGFNGFAVRRGRCRGNPRSLAEHLFDRVLYDDRRFLTVVGVIGGYRERERMLVDRTGEGHQQFGFPRRAGDQTHGWHLLASHVFADIRGECGEDILPAFLDTARLLGLADRRCRACRRRCDCIRRHGRRG